MESLPIHLDRAGRLVPVPPRFDVGDRRVQHRALAGRQVAWRELGDLTGKGRVNPANLYHPLPAQPAASTVHQSNQRHASD